MRLKGVRCDRCGKNVKDSEAWGIGNKAYVSLHLCAKCKVAFNQWMMMK